MRLPGEKFESCWLGITTAYARVATGGILAHWAAAFARVPEPFSGLTGGARGLLGLDIKEAAAAAAVAVQLRVGGILIADDMESTF
jgi:hypothetical protein